MGQQQRKQSQADPQKERLTAKADTGRESTRVQRNGPDNDAEMPETNDAGDAISEDTLYDASGAATGGGVDTPDAVEQSTEEANRKKSHIHQGGSAYMGGGADNGSSL
ncbi:hypothetical protein KDH_02250 [Dictyobacter sp. S3.2.2.5]|uniref:SMP domain-containing protein n=1 Tax=Dictyobacter halimunensis TaxID=3026934 RepID=A0ABQ6FLU2_9CHLR|nr:hypothetical protein KDH_02250 [Dictyobacter sp. S3.2.2.5]